MLPRLNPDPAILIDVQQTAFSHDVLGRWVCGTWSEVSNNGGDPFDVVVIGAGMFGGYIADKLYRRSEKISAFGCWCSKPGIFFCRPMPRTCPAWVWVRRRSGW